MINRVILNNYRSYETLDKTFKDDFNVIQGRNATGKSTIVESIGYALQGSSLQKGIASSWIKEGCSEGSVTLYIDNFIIIRGNKKQLIKDIEGNILARGHTGINEWVELNYGLSPELYKTSFHIAQKEISAFATLGPMEKTKRVEKLLKLDIIDSIKSEAMSTRRATASLASVIEQKLQGVSEFSLSDLEKKEKALNLASEGLERLRDKATKQSIEEIAYKKELDLWNKKQLLEGKLISKDTTLKNISSKIESVEAKIKDNESISLKLSLFKKKQSLERKLAGIVIDEIYFTESLEDLMSLKARLKSSSIAQKTLSKDYANIDLATLDYEVTLDVIDNLEKKLYSVTRDLRVLEDQPSTCPTCDQSMPNMSREISRLKKKIAKDSKELAFKQLSLKVRTLSSNLYKGPETLESIGIMIDSVMFKDTYLDLKELTSVTKPKDIEISTVNLRYQLTDLKYDLSILSRLDEYSEVTKPIFKAFIDYTANIKEVSLEIDHLRQSIQEIKSSMAILAEYKKDLLDSQEELEALKDFIKFIASYRASFSSKIIPMIEENANKIINYLSEGKLKTLNLDENYIIQGYDMYSGSEEDAANFALRLAIAQISRLGTYNTIILDEIAASYDSVREDKLLDVLKSTEMQVIYISHGDINY